MSDDTHDSDDVSDPIDDRRIHDSVETIADRRLEQITALLGLERTYFELGRCFAAGRPAPLSLVEQARAAAALLAAIPDPLVRTRLIELLVNLAEDAPD